MNINHKSVILALSLITAGNLAQAQGVCKQEIKSKNDTFQNDGKVKATSNTTGGASSNRASLRAISCPVLGQLKYSSSGNKYINKGVIEATSKTSGGLSSNSATLESIN